MSLHLIKPEKLNRGDKVATVSLSWGGAGEPELRWRYEQGKQRLEDIFGLEVVEMPHTLNGKESVYRNPKGRAEDLMKAFSDPTIKGIISCIGGDDSVRMLPYIDFDVIKNNPKVFLGYSDTTISHLMCLKAGLSSFYGASVLAEFAENGFMHEYTAKWIHKVLFSSDPVGNIEPSTVWTSDSLPWLEKNKQIIRTLHNNHDYVLLQGHHKVQGRLIGGCIEVLEMAKQTSLWPSDAIWENSILFFETSEDTPHPSYIEYWLRNYGSQGILHNVNGIIWGKPHHNQYYEEYIVSIKKILLEFGLADLPVLYNLSFGHTAPMTVLPYGALAEIDCSNASFSILEGGVL